MSITGTFNHETLKGPGFNICDIELRSGPDPLEHGVLLVQAFMTREDGDPASGDNTIDEDISTFSEGGHTNAYPDQPERIHLIIGLKNSAPG